MENRSALLKCILGVKGSEIALALITLLRVTAFDEPVNHIGWKFSTP